MATASAARSAPNEDGARVALPIFQPIIEAVWADNIAPKAPLSGPSPQARRDLVDIPIDYMSGNRMNGGNFIEHFRRGADGQVADTQYQLVSQDDAYADQGGESNPSGAAPPTTADGLTIRVAAGNRCRRNRRRSNRCRGACSACFGLGTNNRPRPIRVTSGAAGELLALH